MSLINLILNQKIVIVFIAIAGLILLLAIILAIVPRLKRLRAVWAQQRVLAKQQRTAQQQEPEEDVVTEPAPVFTRPVLHQEPAKAVAPSAPSVPSPAPSAPQAGAPPAKAPVPAVPATAPAAVETTPAEPKVSADMQDILSSVFMDGEAMERYKVLMSGIEDQSAEKLLALCEQVSAQLRVKYPVAAGN